MPNRNGTGPRIGSRGLRNGSGNGRGNGRGRRLAQRSNIGVGRLTGGKRGNCRAR